MEAGNRCFDQRVPEEINRRIVDHTADVNLTYSSIARDYLAARGATARSRHQDGKSRCSRCSPTIGRGSKRSTFSRGLAVEPNGFFVVSAHREENVDGDESFGKLVVDAQRDRRGHTACRSSSRHTRERSNGSMPPGRGFTPEVRLLKPLGFFDYVQPADAARARAVRQRYDQRRVVHPQFPGSKSSRGS